MNERNLIIRLQQIFAEFSAMLVLCSEFIEELLQILSKSGQELQFLTALKKYLLKLKENGEAAIGGKGASMEHLSGNAPLCSMRFPFSGSNIRIIFAFIDGKVYLLCALYERAGHRNTEYGAYLPAAAERLQSLLEESD